MMFPALRLRRDIVCQQAVELVTGYLERTLGRAGRRRFEAHLAGCPHCTEYLAQMRKTIELTGSLTPDNLTRRCRTSSSRSTGNGAPARTASHLGRVRKSILQRPLRRCRLCAATLGQTAPDLLARTRSSRKTGILAAR